MATNKINVDEGTDVGVATHTITEDAGTKHLQRVVLNKSDGTDVEIYPTIVRGNGTDAISNSGVLGRPVDSSGNTSFDPAVLHSFNGTSWDRVRSSATNTGVLKVAPISTAGTEIDVATSAKQDTIISHIDGIETSLTTLIAQTNPSIVVGRSSIVDVTLSLDTSAYTAGDVLAATQVVTNAMRVNNGTGVLQSITVIDQDDQKAPMLIFLLSANVSIGTENSAPSISDADAVSILGPPISISSSDYIDLGGVSVAGKDNLGKIVMPASGTRNLYIAVVNGANTPTYTASGIKLRLGFLLD